MLIVASSTSQSFYWTPTAEENLILLEVKFREVTNEFWELATILFLNFCNWLY